VIGSVMVRESACSDTAMRFGFRVVTVFLAGAIVACGPKRREGTPDGSVGGVNGGGGSGTAGAAGTGLERCRECSSAAECGSGFCNAVASNELADLIGRSIPPAGACSAPGDRGKCNCVTAYIDGTKLCIGTGCPGIPRTLCDVLSGEEFVGGAPGGRGGGAVGTGTGGTPVGSGGSTGSVQDGGSASDGSSVTHTNSCGSGCSCNGMSSASCQGESCCAAATVTGCSGCAYPTGTNSTIRDFTMDTYEVTVGRFRNFVNAYMGPPPVGAGEHPLIPGSGWQSSWDSSMPATSTALEGTLNCSTGYSTWVTGNDQLPMNCVNWYTAFAFCVWDGGRLPTELEWQYAAAGGDENRSYPWGIGAPDLDRAVFGFCTTGTSCNCCSLADLPPVGSKPAGAGKWGHQDLAGSVHEWTLDWYANVFPPQLPCDDCANLSNSASSNRVFRGGGWFSLASELANNRRNGYQPRFAAQDYGFRCARSP
jgi:formylglycine-generating enzyme